MAGRKYSNVKGAVGPGFMPNKDIKTLTKVLGSIPKRTPAEEKAIKDRNAKRRAINKIKLYRKKATKFYRQGSSAGSAGAAGLGGRGGARKLKL